MSIGNQEMQDIVTRTGQRIRVRLYQNEDYHQVRDLFMYCMGNGPGAPGKVSVADKLRRPYAYAVYSISTVGLALAIRPSLAQIICRAACRASSLLPLPIQSIISKTGIPRILNYLQPSHLFPRSLHLQSRFWPLALSAASAGSFLAFLTLTNYAYLEYCKECLNDDLKDISGHYLSPEALKKGGQFWVIEDLDKGIIIASVALDTTGSIPEARRMTVHPSYRRLGLGHRLVDALLTHVIKHNTQCRPELTISEVTLETSTYQPGAVQMYGRHGWVVERTEHIAWYGVIGLEIVHMRRKMDIDF